MKIVPYFYIQTLKYTKVKYQLKGLHIVMCDFEITWKGLPIMMYDATNKLEGPTLVLL